VRGKLYLQILQENKRMDKPMKKIYSLMKRGQNEGQGASK